MVKGVASKKRAYFNSVSAPLTFRASPIAVAAWASMLKRDRLRRDASEHTVKQGSRGVALKDERLPENGQHRAQTDEPADVGRIDLTPTDLHFLPQVVDLQPLCRRCWPVSHEVDGWPQEGGVASTGPRKQDDVAEQLQVAHDRREVVVAEIRQHALAHQAQSMTTL